MIKNITIGQYVPGDSFIHKMDPRAKILLSLIYIIALFLVKSLVGYVIVVAFTALVFLSSKLPFKYIFKGIKPIIFLILITAVLNLFMMEGQQKVFQWRFLVIYKEGIEMAVLMVLRLVFLIMGTSILTLTTSPIELTDGIERLLSPFKKVGLPAHELAMMMTIALRFIPTLMDETDKIMKAQMARGADFDSGNIIKKAKGLVPLLVPLFISSFRRADELAMAMEARCYHGGEGRTRMKVLKYGSRDAVAITVTMLFLAGCIGSRFIPLSLF